MSKEKILTVTQFGNPVLRKKAARVLVADIKKGTYDTFIRDMLKTVREWNGAGLAAPQVDKSIQLTVIDIAEGRGKELRKVIVFNPKITRYSRKKVEDWEGCLSFYELRGKVPRSQNVDVEYYNQEGEKVKKTYKDFQARVFQHEIDHLNGVLFVDHMTDMTTLITLEEYNKRVAGE